ncbi:UDP-N-acetylmuramate--L-alanine ligase [Lutispora thermophila]|uniref:UDP-N-acetylmuramate--L-alanine ligase n=1 Tax=Lutispora thermophila DSM 19022 TaxID=1122184 RepID=A0A1M6GE52_9FIRM|nr:UDP-N-acetylmuramate--L-alanine ligase [Lutispora thermophila]SHJ08218.1 UDP-N-acetylmuramate--L-alanine ligase [Lutispora thermophila DSM 19022]
MFLPNNIKTIHFIGIGGISMSGLAEIMLNRGFSVQGSDIQESSIIRKLKSHGIKVNIPQKAENVHGADLIVYTSAVKDDNPEIMEAKKLGIPLMGRATFLGKIMKEYSYGIAIAGCHGKTTSTSMVSIIFKNSNLDPTILLGGELDAIGGNVKIGKSPYFITEACEYMGNFLEFHPFYGIILNIDEDHLDYFKNIQHIKDTFIKFVQLIPKEGCLAVCADNKNAMETLPYAKCSVVTFGIDNEADYMAKDIEFDNFGRPSFRIVKNGHDMGIYSLRIPGLHNVLNALSAFAVSDFFGISKDVIRESLMEFKGTHRRFDILGTVNGITVIDDYAHHPTEIEVTLSAAKKFPHNKLWCIFQPHTYTRTKSLFKEFTCCFKEADHVIITDIYAAREKDKGEIHSRDLVEAANKVSGNVMYMKNFDDIANYVAANAKPGDMVMTVGAGNITELGPIILERLRG